MFHERTKNIEIDFHSIKEKTLSRDVTIHFFNSNDQLADAFTKSLHGPQISQEKVVYVI